MRNRVSLLLGFVALSGVIACAAPKAPARTPATEEANVQALVVGHSPDVPVAVAPAEPPPSDGPVETAHTTLAVRARDPRLALGRRRPASQVADAVHQLEALFRASSLSSPDRPALARRIAEGYAELARGGDPAMTAGAHRGALEYYELITKDYPQDPKIDEAFYYAALEAELVGNWRDARRSYFELIKRVPSSKLIALAYFAFGELFFVEAEQDPSKNDLAEQAYKEVLHYPASTNTVYPDALLRLSQVAERKGETAKAIAMLARLHRELPNSEAAKQAASQTSQTPSAPIRRP
jgi:TolA-binding protein